LLVNSYFPKGSEEARQAKPCEVNVKYIEYENQTSNINIKQLFQRLAVILQRGNANLILGRLPEIPAHVSGSI
jgi:hypothetical protein